MPPAWDISAGGDPVRLAPAWEVRGAFAGVENDIQWRIGRVMSDSLGTYLHDHLAGAEYAIQTLQMMRNQNSAKPLRAFASKLLAEVKAGRETLRNIAEKAGADLNTVKELASSLAQRGSRV